MQRRHTGFALAVGAALLYACGGAMKPEPAETRVEPAPAPALFAEVPVVSSGPFPAVTFRHYGVNPTVDTDEAPRSRFALDVDTAAYTMARAWLERGELPEPAAIRVEDFVNRFEYDHPAPTEAPIALHAEAFPSPNRPGYHVLALSVVARSAEQRAPAPVVVVDVGPGEDGRGALVEAAVAAVATAHPGALDLVDAAATARVVEADAVRRWRFEPRRGASTGEPLRLGLERAAATGRGVVFVTDGGGRDDAVLARAAGVDLRLLGVGRSRYDDAWLERLARRGGRYHHVDRARELERLFARPTPLVARRARVEVDFAPASVERYRLLGYESRMIGPGGAAEEGGALPAGRVVTALYEVKRRGAGPLGRWRVHGASDEGAHTVEQTLSPALVQGSYEAASGSARLALAAAGFAEKLRGAYWARRLTYAAIGAQLDGLPPALRGRSEVEELASLVRRAAALDRRADPYARRVPLAQMNFDHVPVVR